MNTVAIVVLMAFGWWAAPPAAHAMIIMNEVLADPPAIGGDANRDGSIHSTQDEFVELVNTDPSAVSLADWSVSDAISVRHIFASTSMIPGFGFFVVFGGGTPQGFADVAIASSGTLSLNNAGDTLTLRNAAGQVIDLFTYGPEGGMDVSLTRFPDAAGPVVKHTTVSAQPFSPGTTVQGDPTLPRFSDSQALPEPSTLLLTFPGLAGLLTWARRRL